MCLGGTFALLVISCLQFSLVDGNVELEYIFYSNATHISYVSLDGGESTAFVAANSATLGYDELRYRLWYHDAGTNALHSTNLNLSDLQILSLPSDSIGPFTVDTINQTIYYLDFVNKIKSLDFVGNESPDALPVGDDIRDLEIDAHNRSLFFTTYPRNSRNLIRFNLADEVETTLHESVPGLAMHLAVDTTNQTVYWIHLTGENKYKIYKTTYEGQTTQIGPDQTGNVNNIDIAEGNGYFYILDSTSSEIKKYDKTTDTVASTISLAHEITRIIIVTDKDNCAVSNTCPRNSTCTSIPGTIVCSCDTGFIGNQTLCEDVNECAENRCGFNGNCTNTIGSFVCECQTGFEGNGTNCTDIDECEDDPCDVNANCVNNNGSYTCTCNDGYEGDGTNCTDVNECETEAPCHVNATCTNVDGSFYCACKANYSGDGFFCEDAGVIDVPSTLDICYNYYRKASLPNMYGDKVVETANQRFLPFYPLVHTFCSSELETFLCSVFFPRYDQVTFIRQKPCRKACERVYGSCKYAIGRSKFFWPPELECDKFSNDATCYNLTRDATLPKPGRLLGKRRRRETSDCKPTPSTPVCLNVLVDLENPSRYFRTTFQYGNYFGHDSTDEAVYELSKFANLLSSLLTPDDPGNRRTYTFCYQALTILLCHLHLPVCPRSPLHENSCLDSVDNTSACFDAIKDLNSKGANFAWPPVKVNCENKTWFRSDQEDITSAVSLNNSFGPPAPRNVQIIPRYSTRLISTYNDTDVSNTTALYRRLGTTTAYQTTTINPTSGFGTLTLEQLMPATDYEIKLARLRNPSGLPGPFETHTSNTFGQCQNDTTGDKVAQGKILWTTQDGNTTQTRECPYGDNGLEAGDPSRSCECDVPDVCKNPFWLEPYTIGCRFDDVDDGITLSLSSIAEMLIKNEQSPHNASEELVDITSQYASEFTEDDLVLSTLVLENIVQDTQQLSKNGPNIVKIIDNLLNTTLNVLVDSQNNSNATARIVVVLDQFLEIVPLKPGQNFTQNEAKIAVYTQEYDPRDFEGAGAASIAENTMENLVVYDSQSSIQTKISQVSLTMPKSLFRDLDIDTKSQNQRISFAIYRKTSFFTSLVTKSNTSEANTVRRQNSFVVSGSVKGLRLTNLTDPIRITYEPLEPGVDKTTACVFWNFTDDNGLGDWSPAGCSFQGIEDGIVTCHCTHLTNFAILMDVHIDDRDDDHDKALSIISYIGCAISLVGLILTIITVLIYKDLRSKAPTQILLNFCIALSLTLIVFLAAAERSKTSSLAACRAAAIALHYFVLAMFVWTSIQAYNMYLAFVKVMPRYHSKFILKCCVVGWGLPAVIVIIAAASAVEEYGDENFCRVQGLPFLIGFLAPVVLILVVNSIAFALIIRSLLKAGSKVAADKRATGLQHARRGAAILVVLGLTWLFGVLAIRDAKLVFQYLFCIFNSIQGLLVFIFYCVLSSETKAKYRKLLGGKGKESDTSGKHSYPGSSSELKFREINSNKKKSNVYTTSTGSSSLPLTKHDVEMARM